MQSVILSLEGNDKSVDDSLLLPLVAYYEAKRTARIEDGANVGVSLSERASRVSGYYNCFDPIGSFAAFVKWYRSLSLNLREQTLHSKEPSHRLSLLLASVNDAVRIVLQPTEWSALQWDYEADTLTVAHKDGVRLPASVLSDGVRTSLAIVADLAHRCCRLNPQFGIEARLNTPGIALIDEIDLHLHPGWQQQIAVLLQEAFPRLQFILTTHSPQVLSTVDHECIRVIHIENGIGDIRTPVYQTRGVESAEVLAVIMGIDPIPPVPEAVQLRVYRAMIEDRKSGTNAASSLRDELLDHFGSEHPVMKECERLERFFAFKEKRKEGGN